MEASRIPPVQMPLPRKNRPSDFDPKAGRGKPFLLLKDCRLAQQPASFPEEH